jgi:DNA (cytosine-5)-methyltransferase 1
MGYRRAGFDVIGVDLEHHAYPAGEFHQADALDALDEVLRTGRYAGRRIDAVHASPPCQTHSALTKGNRAREGWQDGHVDLIAGTRDRLERTGLPWVIENVQGAPVRRDLTLCGEMFGLAVIRHRYFELGGGWTMDAPAHKPHRGRVAGMRHGQWFTGPYFAVYGLGGGKGTVAQWQEAMGIDWTTDRRELAEAIPPAYTELIGGGLLAALDLEDVAA